MKLLHLAAGRKHVVRALCDESGSSQVLGMLAGDRLLGEHSDLKEAIFSLVFEEVPDAGLPDDKIRVKVLFRDIANGYTIHEFKADKNDRDGKHVGFRIAFFLDGSLIVCTNAFFKERKTPPAERETAIASRRKYYEAKQEGSIELEAVEDHSWQTN